MSTPKLSKAENPQQYAKLANEGTLLGYPVKINGKEHRDDNGVGYHSSVKFFDNDKDHPHVIHNLAQHLPLNPPDAKNTQIEPGQFKDRFGNDVFVIKMHGRSADKIKEHNSKFAHMGYPSTFDFTPHVSVDKATHDRIKASGAKTAHEAGIEFGPAHLKRGSKVLKTYNHQPDSADPVVPDASDFSPPIDMAKNLEKGALKNAGIALGMAASLAGGSHNSEAEYKPHAVHNKAPSYDHGRMLNSIAQVESRGGADVNHKRAGNGDLAYGKYGLMRNTITDTIKAHKDLKAKHGKALALNEPQLHRYMKDHRGLEDTIADRHLSHMEGVLGRSPASLGYGWFEGTTRALRDQKSGKDISNHFHVKKINSAYDKSK